MDRVCPQVADRDTPGHVHVIGSKTHLHPADAMTAQVTIGGGAFSTIINPVAEPQIGWVMTWGDPASVALSAVSALISYDYLLSDCITTKEAIRRLRMLRAARASLAREPGEGDRHG